jgi:hypothetical protein
MSGTLDEQAAGRLRQLCSANPGPAELAEALRQLAKWRSHHIQTLVVRSIGTKVLSGVFEGMEFLQQSAEGCHIPKLLGTYEQPLHAIIEAAIARSYSTVINIGCAEGYYAVGLARRMPEARVLAFDTNADAQRACAELAARNGVGDRVEVGAMFGIEDFARFGVKGVLVVCDIEGGERDLLDPEAAPALAGMDLIVEVHDGLHRGLSAEIARRFAATHEVRLVRDLGNRRIERAPQWLAGLGHLDQLLAVWEWRSAPTPWLELRSRAGPVNGRSSQ